MGKPGGDRKNTPASPQAINSAPPPGGMRLYDVSGARKYLTRSERDAFLAAAEHADRQVRTLAMTLAFAGCRLSEALALTADRVDLVHGIREHQSRRGKGRGIPLWPWSRMTGWRAIYAIMQAAGLSGPHASPKGLRHGFGVAAVSAGIPLNLLQKWLGHAQLTTTAIYASATSTEEKNIAQKMWG